MQVIIFLNNIVAKKMCKPYNTKLFKKFNRKIFSWAQFKTTIMLPANCFMAAPLATLSSGFRLYGSKLQVTKGFIRPWFTGIKKAQPDIAALIYISF
jgi:hypothetical protein